MRKSRPDIIFLMLDTLRADSLRAYGGRHSLSTIDGISAKGVVYKKAIAPGTYTVPSHTSLFLGKRVKGIKSLSGKKTQKIYERTNPFLGKVKFIEKKEMTVAKQLSYLGYRTALVSNNPLVSPRIGMAEGFEHTYDLWLDKIGVHKVPLGIVSHETSRNIAVGLSYVVSRLLPSEFLDGLYLHLRMKTNKKYFEESGSSRIDSGAKKTNSLVRRYFNKFGEGNNFVFINFMECHEGYPSNLITGEYVEQDRWLYLSHIIDDENVKVLKQAYDKRLEYLDSQLANLMHTLKNTGALDNAILIIASDHGQAFLEHGQMYHGVFPYNELVHVPLIAARFRNGKQVDTREEVNNFVSLTALHDSLLDVAYGRTDEVNGSMRTDKYIFSDHVGITELWDARLLKLLSKRSKYANSIYKSKLKYNCPATATYYKGLKLLSYADGRNEMFEMENDMHEEENILSRNRATALEMLRAERIMR